jgi:hypothetical protein
MKVKFNLTSTALLAVVGLSGAAFADGIQFTPVENLVPEQRQAVYEMISQMPNSADVDWDNVVAGVDANGEVMLIPRTAVEMPSSGSPSCTGRIDLLMNQN